MPITSITKRFSDEQKKEILQQLKKGITLKEAAVRYHVSQTSLYLWIKKHTESPSLLGKTKTRKKLSLKQESQLIKQVLERRTQSLKDIAQTQQVSSVTLWKVLKKHTLQTKAQRKTYLLHRGRSIGSDFSYKEKCYLVRAFLQGTPITVLSKRSGASRTILYQWVKRYQQTGTCTSLQTKRPHGSSHWKHGVKNLAPLVPAFIRQHPQETLNGLYRSFGEQVKQPISKSSFYMLLRQFDLNTMPRRSRYAINRHKISKLEDELLHIKKTALVVQTQKYMAKGGEVIAKELWDMSFVVLFCGIFLISWTYFSFGLLPRLPLAEVGHHSLQNVAGRLAEIQENGQKFLAGLPDAKDPQLPDEKRVIEASPSPRQRTPGLAEKFPLKDFSTGVVVMNIHKNSYKIGEEVQVGMAVLDPKGQTICDARMTLTVTTPTGSQEVYSTENGKIIPGQNCSFTSVTHEPDYLTTFKATDTSYKLTLTAETAYGSNVITDSVQVGEPSFQVQRTDFPTRIYPGSPYWLGFTILAQEDFVGEIRESVPGLFSVRQVSGVGKVVANPEGKQSEIVWPVSFRKGEVYRFSYTMQFPEVSPELYKLGPIRLYDTQGVIIYEESRQWQIASDAI
ncbi:MAG: transposase [Patescibacteria group bacterium]